MPAITRDLSRLAMDPGDSSSFGCQRAYLSISDALTYDRSSITNFGNL
jgi:hypothetical protein